MKKSFLLVLAIPFLLLGCKKQLESEVDPYYRELVLYADFSNTAGGIPALTLNQAKSSSAIKFASGQSPNITNDSGRVFLTLPNVRFFDDLGIYRVTNIFTEENRNGKWDQDAENFLTAVPTQRLQVVLVLDMSSSLGSDVELVKDYAINVVNDLVSQSNVVEIGVVLFSKSIQKLPLTQNHGLVVNFIQNGSGTDETRLYEAVDAGIDLFAISAIQPEGRAMIVFTDGKNNAQSDPKFETVGFVETKLKQPIGANQGYITSYAIGLDGKQGGVDKTSLQKLALNGGITGFADNSASLAGVFNKIGNSVSSVWSLVYNRNDSKISNPLQLRFKIQTFVQ